MDKYIGRLLDNRYEVMTAIGTGGMAVVYKALDHRLNRQVALKILKDDYSGDAEFRRRFHAESQAVAMLNHPNIVSVYDVSTDGDADYIVMELVDGITLKQYIERRGGYLNWKESLHFASQIAKALEHAHSQGVIHRDIKPHNVMILKNGSAKVTDFGIARMMSAQNTLTKEALGSVHYISPEQAKGGRVDNRSDIYSLGVVMYEMMTGQPPYDGESPVAVALQHINGGAKMPSLLNPNIPGGLEQIIMRAMAVDPAHRYASAAELLEDMEEFRKNPNILFYFDRPSQEPEPPVQPPVRTTPPTQRPVRRTTTTTGSAAARTATRQTTRPTHRAEEDEEDSGHKMAIAVGAVAILAVVALVLLVFVITRGDGKPSTPLVEVPQLVGHIYENVKNDYKNLEIRCDEELFDENVPAGQIIRQDHEAHTNVEAGTVIHVSVSLGPQTGQMVYLVNQPVDQAKRTLESMTELKLKIFIQEENSDFEAGRVISTDPEMGETLRTGQEVVLYVSAGPITDLMPDLVDKSQASAEAILRNMEGMDLQLEFLSETSEEIAKGHVTRTFPEGGITVKVGQKITVYVSSGSAIIKTDVPNVVGMDISKAVSMLTASKLKYDYVQEFSDAPKDQVIAQSPEKNEEVAEGTVVMLTISKGPEPTEPPTTEAPTTEPSTTAPEPVSRIVTLVLPSGITENYKIQIYCGNTPVTDPLPVDKDSGTELNVALEGSGIAYFDFYVNGTYVDAFRVNFDNTGTEKIQLNFTVNG